MKNILNHEIAHQKFFEELTRIPHASYQEKAYSEYLIAFAKEHGFRYLSDELHNVIIYKEASLGYEDHPAVILQAHTDMVCEKNKDVTFDFEQDALDLYIEDGYLKAKGTTLGADDGAGVAYMLAVLADKEALHPRLECVFTVQEEVGLYGALALKKEYFTAKRMINLDDGGERSTCITSAGGMNVIMKKPRILAPCGAQAYKLELTGLRGGHSGGEIDKEKGNANKLLARILYQLNVHFGIQLHSIEGGVKDNAIPREASAIFLCDKEESLIQHCVDAMYKDMLKELEFSDAGLRLQMAQTSEDVAMSIEDSEDIIKLLMTLPNGLRHRSMSIDGLSVASSNIGVVLSDEESISVNCSVRGALESFVDTIASEMDCLAEMFNFESEHEARYPAWSYDARSDMREILKGVCQDVFHEELGLVAVHGGLECGIFKALDEDMDIVTMGPIMEKIHTPEEAMNIASFDATFQFLKAFLVKL